MLARACRTCRWASVVTIVLILIKVMTYKWIIRVVVPLLGIRTLNVRVVSYATIVISVACCRSVKIVSKAGVIMSMFTNDRLGFLTRLVSRTIVMSSRGRFNDYIYDGLSVDVRTMALHLVIGYLVAYSGVRVLVRS